MERIHRYEAMYAGWSWCREHISLRAFLLHIISF